MLSESMFLILETKQAFQQNTHTCMYVCMSGRGYNLVVCRAHTMLSESMFLIQETKKTFQRAHTHTTYVRTYIGIYVYRCIYVCMHVCICKDSQNRLNG